MNVIYIAATALALSSAGSPAAPALDAAAIAAPQQGGGNGKGQGGGEARGGGNGGGRAAKAEPRRQAQPPRQGGEGRGRGGDRPRAEAARPAQGSQGRGRDAERPANRGGSNDAAPSNRGRGNGSDDARSAENRGRGSSNPGRGDDVREATRGALVSAAARRRVSDDDVRRGLGTLPAAFRRFDGSTRRHERMVLGAAALGAARGLRGDAVNVITIGDRVRVVNRRDELLFDLDERRARDLGSWELRRLGDRPARADAPAFCRSGEGHPVWGRDWCVRKGWGLGRQDRWMWSRANVDDVVYRRIPTGGVLDRGTLAGVLGDIVLGRLSLHSLALGFDEPLAGVWVAEPQSPQILRIRAGDRVVAELVDVNRDNRAEVLYVVQPL